MGDIGAFEIGRVVEMDVADAVDDLADTAGQLAGGQLALAAKLDLTPPQTRNDDRLYRHDAGRDEAERDRLHQDEDHGRGRLAAEEERADEGLSDEAADGLHLIPHHGRQLRRLGAAVIGHGKAQQSVDKLEAQLAQHALAQPALVGVDVELEQAVDDHQEQEDQGKRHQGVEALQVDTRENLNAAARQEPGGHIDGDAEIMLGRVLRREPPALDGAVDDQLGQVERQEVGRHRRQHDEQDVNLHRLGVTPGKGEHGRRQVLADHVLFATHGRGSAATGSSTTKRRSA